MSDLWHRLEKKVEQMIRQLDGKSPHAAGKDGKYDSLAIDWWTSGFWPGILWIMYKQSKNPLFKEAAWTWDENIESMLIQENDFYHDLGFQFLPTAVAKYKYSGDIQSKRRGLTAATLLAGRYNPEGRFIRAWNGSQDTGWAIIDCTMNLSLLYWASIETNDPRFRHVATAHADTTIKHFIRPDGSVHHIVSFDPETGERIEALGGQGFSPTSAWSRGQAWAIYGLANTARNTGDARFLDASKRAAHYWMAALPEDRIPYWDFRISPFDEHEPRDTSAAAIAASGLLELSELVPEDQAAMYRNTAIQMLVSLDQNYGTWNNSEHEGILTGGTAHKPDNWNVDVSLIYGDYFFVEAVAKLLHWQDRIF
ncbi:glycoside hydrolase family 88 protein [Paenibacillus massiliensis]|uniref:glycoside hydrolase family 88 protein n=1 Tax=Paenibacillus massiliensis TaxID=225917 RepID=UPI00055F1956|nr:glycoside hydrolase family 88 protein [Paenibacillus massiliensis]